MTARSITFIILCALFSFACNKENRQINNAPDSAAKVFTLEATEITEFRATLNGALNASDKDIIQKIGFFVSDTASSLDDLKNSGLYIDGKLLEDKSFNASLGDPVGKAISLGRLTEDTKYYYVAVAMVNDKEIYGDVKIFTTPAFIIIVTTEDATEVTEFAGTLNGVINIESIDNISGRIDFIYSSTASTLNELKVDGIRLSCRWRISNKFQAFLTNLQCNTKYYYVAVATVGDKNYYGDVKSFSTLEIPEIIDLGLSVKWRSWNVGANSPQEEGDYFAWAETSPKDNYHWSNYKWCNGSNTSITRYCKADQAECWGGPGEPDDKTEFSDYDYVDDAAKVNLGGNWRTPTDVEWNELYSKCVFTATNDYKGTKVPGVIIKSTISGYEDKSIFLPRSCCKATATGSYSGRGVYYWSSSLAARGPYWAWEKYEYSGGTVGHYNSERCYGRPIRPVTD